MDFISSEMVLYLLLTGSVVGFLSGLLGIGGGVIIIPTLLWLLSGCGLDDQVLTHVVFGTSLAVGTGTALSSSTAHRKRVKISTRLVLMLAVGSITGAQLGGYAAHLLSGEILQIGFGTLLLFISYLLLRPLKDGQSRGGNPSGMLSGKPVLVGLGLIVGSVSAIIGTGGAILTTTILVLFLKCPIHRTVGITSSMMVFTATSGALAYIFNGWDLENLPPYSLGYVNLYLMMALVTTSTITAKLGVRLAHRIDPRPLQQVLGVFLLLIAAEILTSNLTT